MLPEERSKEIAPDLLHFLLKGSLKFHCNSMANSIFTPSEQALKAFSALIFHRVSSF